MTAKTLHGAKGLALPLLGGLMLAAAATPALAVTPTFAVFTPTDATANVTLSGLSLMAKDVVRFRFTDPGLASLGVISAQWTFNATEASASTFDGYPTAVFGGTFAYAYLGPVVVTAGGVTLHPGDNLLSGSFGQGIFSGSGSAASLNASAVGGKNVVLSSSLLKFDPAGGAGIAFSLTSIVPPTEVVPSGQLADFTAVASGNFAASPAGAPEPASWALMLLGFGGLGAGLRARRKAVPA